MKPPGSAGGSDEAVDRVARVVATWSGGVVREAVARLREGNPSPPPGFPQAQAFRDLVDAWPGSPASLAEAIAGAAAMARHLHGEQRVELVWTGPPVPGSRLRRLDQVFLEVLRAAERRVVVVSYSAYHDARKGSLGVDALRDVIRRGIELHLVLESAGTRVKGNPLDYIPVDVRRAATVWHWPETKRGSHPDGRTGAQHAKFVLADDRDLLVSSANLSPDAMEVNLEVGLRVTGGDVPRTMAAHVDSLWRSGVWARV
jgi:cardiolipin synthase